MEVHPRINKSDPPLINEKIILGSFPTWSLARSHDGSDNAARIALKNLNNDFDFFYGSYSNGFWNWYQNHIDNNIIPNDPKTIEVSLKARGIGITDIILSCCRNGKSSLDKHLSRRIYNVNFLATEGNPKTKILCTSKAVLNSMLLSKTFFEAHPNLSIDVKESRKLSKTILLNVGQDSLKHPIACVLNNTKGKTIECVAIPSPGSPFRKLTNFGCGESIDKRKFLTLYLTNTFTWFKS